MDSEVKCEDDKGEGAMIQWDNLKDWNKKREE